MEKGYSVTYGAREMERTVDSLVVRPLGRALIDKRFLDGDTVYVDVREETLTLQKASSETPKTGGSHDV